ncbi:hypothetical protein WR25_22018 [Diploscapter pachys]|uniref:Myotubularin-related protein 13 n=1 Tax=Diploscapter pachys TaxID=2018661 RepID=A0A2A2JQY8_9BILA|nr:hypothetical protein WR25_22018 [Diploscapter pachys]
MSTSRETTPQDSDLSSSVQPQRLVDYFAVLDYDQSQIRTGTGSGVVSSRFPENDWTDLPFSHSLQAVYEACDMTEFSTDDLYDPNVQLYKSRVFVILSRHPYFDIFRRCLNVLYETIQTDSNSAETMIATLVSTQFLPSNPTIVSLGKERFSVRPLEQPTIPLTSDRVCALMRSLGSIHNLLTLLRAVLCDQKIILHSSSLSQLSDAGYAIRALLYPLEYTYTFVSVLPEGLYEYLESPTPYLMGVVSSGVEQIPPCEAILVDLDIGEIRIPSSVIMHQLPEPFGNRLIVRLQMVLNADRCNADLADPPPKMPPRDSFQLDKAIRACFLMFFAEIFYDYRVALELVRLHRRPLIVFHKSAFMGLRQLSSSLLHQLIDGQMFQVFISTRGLPYRQCDIFDTIVCQATVAPFDREEERIEELAKKLADNERQEYVAPSHNQSGSQAINWRATKPITVIEQTKKYDVVLDGEKINKVINENLSKWVEIEPSNSGKKRIVPVRQQTMKIVNAEEKLGASSRRLQVLSTFLDRVFENKLTEAMRMLCAVEASLRSVDMRVALCRLLSDAAVPVTKATLSPPQFELIVRLMNTALDQESEEDEYGISYACLHLSNLYCRRLSQGAHQFAYTCIQDHEIWKNQRFWEAAFFHDIHEQLRRQYGNLEAGDRALTGNCKDNMWNLIEEPTAMSAAASRLASIKEMSEEELNRCESEEESIVYGQAKHYINLMVYLRVPLDPSRLRRIDKNVLENNHRNAVQQQMRNGSFDGSDAESGFIENVNDGDLGAVIVAWICRLTDQICSAASLNPGAIDRLTANIPGFVAAHIDNLEQVYMESLKITPPLKTKLLSPILLRPTEKVTIGGLRCVLFGDPRFSSTVNLNDSADLRPVYLPAEGAIFLTNYRIIFKGRPVNPYYAEELVIRSVPIMSVVKDKLVSDACMRSSGVLDGLNAKMANGLHDCVQIRTSCFRLLNIAFDEDVTKEQVDELLKALSAAPSPLTRRIGSDKSLNAILPNQTRKALTINPNDSLSNQSDYLDILTDGTSTIINPLASSDLHRRHSSDYERLRLKGTESLFRISYVNTHYDLVKSYPSQFVVPSSVSDDTFVKICKGFKHGRMPVVTWINENGACLIRGSGLNSATVVQKIKKVHVLHSTDSASAVAHGSRLTLNSRESTDTPPMHSAEIQEKYLYYLAQCSPSMSSTSLNQSDSLTSLGSMQSFATQDDKSMTTGGHDGSSPSLAKKFVRNSVQRASNNASSLLDSRKSHSTSNSSYQRHRSTGTNLNLSLLEAGRKNLYIFVEKQHAKLLRAESNFEFATISFPTTQEMKIAFKKMLRAVKPSIINSTDAFSDPFIKELDDAGWLKLVSRLLSIATGLASVITVLNSSAALCIEDGWDTTCQLTSLTQIMLDPFYRTINGFRVLIEKEWLAFGHRFSYRANHTISSQSSGIAPAFLLFLDCVHQLFVQYPHAFEFNDFYLRFLAHHSQSAFFRTFLLDSEFERVQVEDAAPETSVHHRGCIWSYIEKVASQRPLFHNLCYNPNLNGSLIPACSIAAIESWSFYYEETIEDDPPYDLEIAEAELAERKEERLTQIGQVGGVTTGRGETKIVDVTIRSLDLEADDAFTYLLQTNDRMNPLNKNQERDQWTQIWSALEEQMRQTDEDGKTHDSPWARDVEKLLLKKAAAKILYASNTMSTSKLPSRNHAFEPYSGPASQSGPCSLCKVPLYGTVVKSGMRCFQCGIYAHEKCTVHISGACVSQAQGQFNELLENRQLQSLGKSDTITEGQGSDTARTLSLTRRPTQNQTPLHQGYLSKKGAKFKLWSPRWFVLHPTQHKLYYYENEGDSTCRGFIDLIELRSVDVELVGGNKAILELRTFKRDYSLMADSRSEAELWKEKIEQALSQ